ncbi:MAG: hypothetical protein FWE31_01190 [Firmicutes bacterium]|nr:hypothetical protein [Bacillota bacterium]
MTLAKGEKIVKEFDCDEVPRLLSMSYKTKVTVTNKRIIRESHGKKWGRKSVFNQDVDLNLIAGFSSSYQMMNRAIVAVLFACGWAFMIAGIVFLGLFIAETAGQDEIAQLSVALTLIPFGLAILMRGLSTKSGSNNWGSVKMLIIFTGSLFIFTGAFFLINTLLSPVVELLLEQYGYMLILAMVFPPIGVALIAIAAKIKPSMRFEIHIKYSAMSYQILRRNTIIESFRKKKDATIKLSISPSMLQMFDELPAIVRELNP